jgi:hypothetical protein
MNPPDQPTPRTQAIWKTHCGFSNEDEATEAVCDFRDLSNTLERELAAAKAECEELLSVNATGAERLRFVLEENSRLRAELKELSQVYELNKVSIDELHAELARAERAEAEVELDEDLQLATESSLKTAIARAEKAEAELSDYKAALEIANSSSDELVCRWRELHAEVERLKIIEEKFRQSPMWDVLAIVQTRNNWQACAEKAENKLNKVLKQLEELEFHARNRNETRITLRNEIQSILNEAKK